MASATVIPTGYTQKASINRKDQTAQTSTMLSTGQAILDTTGIALSQERRASAKSMRQQLRRLVSKDNTKLLMWSHAGFIFQELLAAPPATVADFITTVNAALASAASIEELAPAGEVPSISFKKVLAALLTVNGADGTLMMDMLGGDFTTSLYRPNIPRSMRDLVRRLILKHSVTNNLYFSNTVGRLITAIRDDAPVDLTALNVLIGAAFTASTDATAIDVPTKEAKTTSLLNQLQQVLVTVTDGSVAINDTGDDLAAPNLKLSQQMELKRLLDSNGESPPTFKIQFTSGIKLAKVAALGGGANYADLLAAFSDAA